MPSSPRKRVAFDGPNRSVYGGPFPETSRLQKNGMALPARRAASYGEVVQPQNFAPF